MAVVPAPPPLFAEDPFARHAAARGPVLRDPAIEAPEIQLKVDTRMLDISGDLEMGVATINRAFPLFPRVGRVNLRVLQPLLESQWRFWEMGFGDNLARRVLLLYQYTPPQPVLNLAEAFRNAALAILQATFRQDLAPLDKDDEFLAWRGGSPNFHAYLEPGGCTLNRFEVRAGRVQRLIDRIQGPRGGGLGGVPDRMAREFIGLYQDRINLLQSLDPQPLGEIQALQEKIQQLRQFQAGLN
jgi:hypothetical protein